MQHVSHFPLHTPTLEGSFNILGNMFICSLSLFLSLCECDEKIKCRDGSQGVKPALQGLDLSEVKNKIRTELTKQLSYLICLIHAQTEM